jgi:hypothetical protein
VDVEAGALVIWTGGSLPPLTLVDGHPGIVDVGSDDQCVFVSWVGFEDGTFESCSCYDWGLLKVVDEAEWQARAAAVTSSGQPRIPR